jgi:hypothetical protein
MSEGKAIVKYDIMNNTFDTHAFKRLKRAFWVPEGGGKKIRK